MKNITFSAVMANSIKNLLQGYTKGIRFVAVLTLLLTMGIGQAWGAENCSHTSSGDVNQRMPNYEAGYNMGTINVWFSVNGASYSQKGSTSSNINQDRTITTNNITSGLKFNKFSVPVYCHNQWHGDACSQNGARIVDNSLIMYWKVSNPSGTMVNEGNMQATTNVSLSWDGNGATGTWTSQQSEKDLLTDVTASTTANQTYTMDFWYKFQCHMYNKDGDDWGSNVNVWYPGNSQNFKYQFTIPKTTLTVSQSGANGGATVSSGINKTIALNTEYSLTASEVTGYDFVNWTTSNNNITITNATSRTGAKVKFTSFANATIIANYKAKNCTVTLNKQSGTGGTSSVTATYGQAMPSATMPTRTGYTFNGYFDAASGGTQYYKADGTSARTWNKTANTTLYAQWTPNTYTVQFNANGGEGSMDNQEFTYDAEQTLVQNKFTKAGCTFSEWNTAADGFGTSYTNQQRVSNLATEGTIILYARWSTSNCKWLETDIANIESDNEVVIAMTNGVTTWALHQDYYNSGDKYPLAATLEVNGNEITQISDKIKWNISGNATDGYILYPNGQTSTWLYCTGSSNTIKIGSGTEKNFVIENGYLKNINKLTYTEKGIEINVDAFLGVSPLTNSWRHYPNTTTTVIKGQTLKFYKKVCLDENNYWVTWDAGEGLFEDGKSTKIEHYQVGAKIELPTPTRTGYNFTWDPTPAATMPAQNITYTAQWELKTTTITLAHQDGEGDTESITATYSQEMPKITPPTRTGYNFQGYFSSNGGTGTKYYNADGTSATTWDQEAETFTLIAYWTAKTTTVSFDQNGGTGGQTSTETATYDEPMPTPITVPTKEGHTFLGYYDATTDGTQYYDAAGNSTKEWNKEDATFTLYAQWQVNQYTVTWDPNGGHWNNDHNKKKEEYNYGAQIVKPAAPEKTGYVFYGWQPEIEEKMPSRDLTYTAEWREAFCNEYSFHWGNGSDEQVKVDNDQACFVQKDNTHEWQVTGFIIPEETKYFVGFYGWWYDGTLGLGDDYGQYSKSAMKEWTWTGDQVMYLAHIGRGYTLGHAKGAKGTLRIYDNSSLDNLDVAFIPDGYGITITGDTKNSSHAFHK